jgi:hypothetical protein
MFQAYNSITNREIKNNISTKQSFDCDVENESENWKKQKKYIYFFR